MDTPDIAFQLERSAAALTFKTRPRESKFVCLVTEADEPTEVRPLAFGTAGEDGAQLPFDYTAPS